MRAERLTGWALGLLLVLAVVLGGASARGAGAAGNALLQIVAVILILFALWRRREEKLARSAKALIWIVGLYALLVLLSMVPLPPAVWTSLPGRAPIANGFRLMGMELPYLPLSLGGLRTPESLIWLLPPAAAYLLTLQCPAEHRQGIAWLLIALAAGSIVLGAAQLLGGTQSPLRFYSVTNVGVPVGFFSNANHFATLLLCALPLTGHLAARGVTRNSSRARRGSSIIIAVSLGVFLLIGIAMIGSLAGYGLILPAAGASFLLYRRAARGGLSYGWIAALGAVMILFAGYALAGPVARQSLSDEVSEQPASRLTFARTTLKAIADSFPAGTGLGTFQEVYRPYEDPDVADREYVNHAHDDYLEIVLELGLAGILLVVAFFAWWVWQSRLAWVSDFPGSSLARAGSIMILIVLMHSLVDYPLRTSTMATVFAIACGFLIPPSQPSRRRARPTESSARHLEAD